MLGNVAYEKKNYKYLLAKTNLLTHVFWTEGTNTQDFTVCLLPTVLATNKYIFARFLQLIAHFDFL
jgi:hypothetical protein